MQDQLTELCFFGLHLFDKCNKTMSTNNYSHSPIEQIDELINDINIQKQKIVICGGGNAAHVFTGLSAANLNNEVHLTCFNIF